MPDLLADVATTTASPYTLVAFAGYMIGVFLLGWLSHKLLSRGSFLKEYFLGDRQLNAWVLGLTYVATSVSAGSFVGFPSFIYQYGWIMALWIGGYMVGGLVSKGVLAKRLNQASRLSGAITVPDVLRDRFQSPALGLLAGIFLTLFLVFNLIGQFKAGGLIFREACTGVRDHPAYDQLRSRTARTLAGVGLWNPNHPEPQKEEERHAYEEHQRYPDYVLGMLVFAITVVAYTAYGGFWAVTWTDVLQGIVIVLGALLLMVLALHKVGGLTRSSEQLRAIPGMLTGPGPNNFVPLGKAVSYFFQWTLIAMAQPVGMVRLMACRDTPTLRTSLFMIGLYYALIYLPLVLTFTSARALYPTEFVAHSDRVMPAMALRLTEDWPILGGLILAAPYAAAMSAVAGFLLLMSSSLVRDIYQRNINPQVSPRMVRRISYGTTAVVGVIVTLAALRPPDYLQLLILFTGAGMGCTFLGPTILGLYWPRATRPGALASLLSGFVTVCLFYVLGWVGLGKERQSGASGTDFAPLYLLDIDPGLWGLVVSLTAGVVVSWLTQPPPRAHVDRYFLAEQSP
jgi:SSS family solute:Na+ symporter/sodium/pantothenate symporter